MSIRRSSPRPRPKFSSSLEPLEARTLLNATADVGEAGAGSAVARSGVTVTVNVPSGDYVVRSSRLYLYGTVSSPGVRVEVYATPRRGEAILIGQDVPWNGENWSIGPDVKIADGVYTIEARAVEIATGLVGEPTPLASKLTIDDVGPRILSARLLPRQGQIVVTFRDYGGDRDTGSGLDMLTATYPGSYAFDLLGAPWPGDPDDTRWDATSAELGPTRLRGPQRMVVTINHGAPIPDGDYRLYVQSPDPLPPDLPFEVYMAEIRVPYYVRGIRDEAGNPLAGGPTSTIAPPDSNDFAASLAARPGRGPRPGRVAPPRLVRAFPAHRAAPMRG